MHDPEMARLREAAFRRCRKAGATREEADDCAQEALLAALRAKGTGYAVSAAWVRTVAYRRFVDLVRRRSRERSGALAGPETDRTQEGPEDVVVRRLHARWLTDALEELPVVTRSVCEGVSQGDDIDTLAHRHGLTRRSIESHLTRARRTLRQRSLKGLLPIGVLSTLQDALSRLKSVVSVTSSGVATPATLAVFTALAPLLLHSPTGPSSKPELPMTQQQTGHPVRSAAPAPATNGNREHRSGATTESAPAPARPLLPLRRTRATYPLPGKTPKLPSAALPTESTRRAMEGTRRDVGAAARRLAGKVPQPSASPPANLDKVQPSTPSTAPTATPAQPLPTAPARPTRPPTSASTAPPPVPDPGGSVSSDTTPDDGLAYPIRP